MIRTREPKKNSDFIGTRFHSENNPKDIYEIESTTLDMFYVRKLDADYSNKIEIEVFRFMENTSNKDWIII